MPPETWTILKLLQWTTTYFESHHIEQPRVDAEVLLAHALSLGRVDLYLMYDRPLGREELAAFKPLIQRRAAREPVAYIVGEREFWSLALKVTPDVLIPRPETEILVEAALKIVPADHRGAPWRILDLGTGSGAIVLALVSERPGHDFYASDRSEQALQVARTNAAVHGLEQGITWLEGDWFQVHGPRIGPFDMIVSNPPYIPTGVLDGLAPEIVRHEPRDALNGGAEGLDAIRLIVNDAPQHLVPEGWLLLEMGHDQGARVGELIRSSGGYGRWDVVKDFGGLDRVVCVQKKAP